MARGVFEGNLRKGIFTYNYNQDGKSVRFEKHNVCPACGYRQKMAEPEPASLKVKVLRAVGGSGCGALVLTLYTAVLVGRIRGIESEVSPYALPILIGVPLLVILGALLLRHPNRAFMRQHGIKKKDLPPARSPEVTYGPVRAVE